MTRPTPLPGARRRSGVPVWLPLGLLAAFGALVVLCAVVAGGVFLFTRQTADSQPAPRPPALAAVMAQDAGEPMTPVPTFGIEGTPTPTASRTPLPTATPPPATSFTRYIVGGLVNSRSCPDIDCDLVDVLRHGQVVSVTGEVEGQNLQGNRVWLRLDLEGREAYTHSSLTSGREPPPLPPPPTVAPPSTVAPPQQVVVQPVIPAGSGSGSGSGSGQQTNPVRQPTAGPPPTPSACTPERTEAHLRAGLSQLYEVWYTDMFGYCSLRIAFFTDHQPQGEEGQRVPLRTVELLYQDGGHRLDSLSVSYHDHDEKNLISTLFGPRLLQRYRRERYGP